MRSSKFDSDVHCMKQLEMQLPLRYSTSILTYRLNLKLELSGERDFERRLSFPRTRHNFRGPRLTNLTAKAPYYISLVRLFNGYFFIENQYLVLRV